MSGPQYPPAPAFGSNSIGNFVIGVSQIGDVPWFDVWTTIISQYANSPRMTALMTNLFQYTDPTINFQSFFDTMWNIDTALDKGLDNWGVIIGVSRIIQVTADATYFGPNEAGSWVGFEQGPFYAGAPISSNFRLSNDAYRILLFAKALANITDGSIPAVNQLLLNLFPNRGNCYIVDNQDMTMVYKFEFVLSPVEVSIVNLSGVLPRPNGVEVSVESL